MSTRKKPKLEVHGGVVSTRRMTVSARYPEDGLHPGAMVDIVRGGRVVDTIRIVAEDGNVLTVDSVLTE